MEIVIRRARKDDKENFLRVYKSAYAGMEKYAYTKDRSIKDYFRWLYGRDSGGFFVAECDGKVVGFVASDSNWNYDEGEIHEIVVMKEYQGKRIGKKLLKMAEEYLRERGHKKFGLWVGKTNYNAIKFYEKMGYRRKDGMGVWIRMEK